jgi:uncharacterized membrane protein
MDRAEQVVSKQRPWTVYALTLLFVVGSIAGLAVDEDRGFKDLLFLVAGSGIAYAIWIGAQWAFSTIFMLSTLCAALLACLLVFQLFLFETGLEGEVLWGLASSLVTAALLIHPASKRFASFTQ